MKNLVWFRCDLRVKDNPALAAACSGDEVIAIYIWVDDYRESFPIAWRKVDFIRRQLQDLTLSLQSLNIPLIVARVERAEQIANYLSEFIHGNNLQGLYFNNEYPWYERLRDKQVTQKLRGESIEVFRFDDRLIMPPQSIRNGNGSPYKVFTPYKNRWLSLVTQDAVSPLSVPATKAKPITENISAPARVDLSKADCFGLSPFAFNDLLWPVGEVYTENLADKFFENGLEDYHENRDFPARAGTSTLSPYLAIGVISARQLVDKLLTKYGSFSALPLGASTWLNEIIWREFYQHLIVDFPFLCKEKPMQEKTIFFPWRGETPEYFAWTQGQTGIPIVDAAMKQLLTTGWMHNRLRMVVASFLTKNLRVDWRLGERFFMEHLIDGDFAANNGGWQWSASTGADAAPYFRVFNPVAQSERFDPDTDFLLEWLPQLAELPKKMRHNPSGKSYIAPIVDLKQSRKETIALFAQAETGFK